MESPDGIVINIDRSSSTSEVLSSAGTAAIMLAVAAAVVIVACRAPKKGIAAD